MKTIKVEGVMIDVFERMLRTEIDNQKKWLIDDEKKGFEHLSFVRKEIIRNCNDILKDLKED